MPATRWREKPLGLVLADTLSWPLCEQGAGSDNKGNKRPEEQCFHEFSRGLVDRMRVAQRWPRAYAYAYRPILRPPAAPAAHNRDRNALCFVSNDQVRRVMIQHLIQITWDNHQTIWCQ